jgi:hypothetical protein
MAWYENISQLDLFADSVQKHMADRCLPVKHQYDPLIIVMFSLNTEECGDFLFEIWERQV